MKLSILFLFLLAFVLGNCLQSLSPIDRPTLDSSVNSKTVTYPLNFNFRLILDLHATMGYHWEYSISDSNIVKIDSTSYAPKSGNPDQIGGITIETFYFCTLKTGLCKITLVERRGWEPEEIEPINSISFNVRVTD
jgi:predicted secreted protein